jgi:hypothetical protein
MDTFLTLYRDGLYTFFSLWFTFSSLAFLFVTAAYLYEHKWATLTIAAFVITFAFIFQL